MTKTAARRQATAQRTAQRTTLWAALVLLLFVAVSAGMNAAGAAGAAGAEELCLPRAEAVAQLDAQYRERAVGRGLAAEGRTMVELFVGESGTWTIVVTDTAGRSCIVASGENWTPIPLLVGQLS